MASKCFWCSTLGEDFQFDQCLSGSFNPTTVSSYGFNHQLVTVGRLLGGGFKVFLYNFHPYIVAK